MAAQTFLLLIRCLCTGHVFALHSISLNPNLPNVSFPKTLVFREEKHLDYRQALFPGALQLVIKNVQESIDYLHFLTMGLHIYRSKQQNIRTKRDHVCCIFHVQVHSIQSRTSE